MISPRIVLAGLLAILSPVAGSRSCEFCNAEQGATMTAEYARATAVVLARVEQGPQLDGDGAYFTDVTIDQEIKPHPCFKDKKTIRLKRKFEKSEMQFVLFCDVVNGTLQPYHAVDVPAKSELIKYLQGAVALKDKTGGERLRYSFDYLNSSDLAVAVDAYREFAVANYKDYMTMAKTLPADRIAGWLKDPKTPPYRYGLYSSLLGHCGTAEHGKLLRSMIDESIKNKTSNIDGLLAGYVMLERQQAWDFVQSILRDGKEDFLVRFSCVRVATFLREQRPDLVPAKDLTDTVCLLLEHPDMADMAIDYLRKAKAWERTGQVLDLCGKKSPGKNYDNDFVKRAVMRFALISPEPRAAAFVNDMRRRSAEFVATTEELLKLDGR